MISLLSSLLRTTTDELESITLFIECHFSKNVNIQWNFANQHRCTTLLIYSVSWRRGGWGLGLSSPLLCQSHAYLIFQSDGVDIASLALSYVYNL